MTYLDICHRQIAEGKYKELLQYDQLNKQQAQGLAFVGFQEGEITFPPTYKFDLGLCPPVTEYIIFEFSVEFHQNEFKNNVPF